MPHRVEDQELGKVMYLFTEQSKAETEASYLANGQPEHYEVKQHSTGLGWFIKDKKMDTFMMRAGECSNKRNEPTYEHLDGQFDLRSLRFALAGTDLTVFC